VGEVTYSSRTGRAILVATVLGSGIAFLDGTVVNVALPQMATSLDAGFSTMQWVLDAYLLTLGAFVLVGGAVGDVLGRRAVFLVGLVGFGVASAACGLAPNGTLLVVARAVQGLAAALLVPGSLALITSLFDPADRDRAIGAWSGLAGLASAIGPFLGGWLVDAASWRWVFLLNLPLVAVAVVVTIRGVPDAGGERRAGTTSARRSLHRVLDIPGAALVALSLTLLVVPLIERGLPTTTKVILLTGAAVTAVAFVVVERRVRRPMLPFGLIGSRTFVVANAVTFVVYGALSGALFLLAVQLQTAMGYSALEAGAALVPLTVLLLLFSARVGALLPRFGARPLLTAGPLIAGAGLLLMTRSVPGASYLSGVLPGVLVFSVGMCLVVAPITSTALGALATEHAGLASGVNNAVARIAGLLAVAVLPAIAGAGSSTRLSEHGFTVALTVSAVLAAAGGVLALTGLPRSAAAPDSVAA
jgi:EmrB/QacA subfamily drug resistance transporter